MAESVKQLKDYARESVDRIRKEHSFHAICNARRGFANISTMQYSVEDVEEIANKLKSKGAISVEDLTSLMYALNEHEDHISAFFKVSGALNGLIKELIGHNATKQLYAIGCVCNLAFSQSRTNVSLAKASGAYLATFLHPNQDKTILELTSWALGNMIANNEKAAYILKDQGIVENLIPLLNVCNGNEVISSVAYALSQILDSKWDYLEDSQIIEISKHVLRAEKSKQVLWLLYLLSTKDASQELFFTNFTYLWAMNTFIKAIDDTHLDDFDHLNCLLRICANLCSPEVLKRDSGSIFRNDNEIRRWAMSINWLLILTPHALRKETIWFLGNLYNFLPDSPTRNVLFSTVSTALMDAYEVTK